MAFLLDDDQDIANSQAQAPAQGSPLIGGQSAAVGGSASPTGTGIGKGGTGGWTNLQNYISANNTDTGSASALQSAVGSQFGKEQESMQKASTDYVKGAEEQVNKAKISNEDADSMLDQSAQAYSYDKTQTANPTYSQNVDKVRGALTGQYQGPKSYEYGFDAKTQEYGQALGKEGNFDGLLKDLYSQRTPNALSQGQFNLQKQLDVFNPALNETRDRLAGEYQGLGQKRDETVKQTTEKLGGLEQTYRTNQNALKDYLTGKSTSLDTSIGQQEADARKAYEQALLGGTGMKSIGYDTILSRGGNQPDIAPRAALGIWGDNLNWSQIEKEGQNLSSAYNPANPGGIYWYGAQPELDSRKQALAGFFNEQDTKYKDVADMDEKKYNVLMDFLGSDGPRKEQGFQVRKK